MLGSLLRAKRLAQRAANRVYALELRALGVELGDEVWVEGRPLVNLVEGRIRIGSNSVIWSRDTNYHARIFPVKLQVQRGATIDVGPRCRLNGCVLQALSSITLEEDVYCASGTTIIDSDGHHVDAARRVAGERDEPKSIVIGRRAWLGLNVIVLKGVTIGEDVVVAAGSVVSKALPPRTLCGGNPARVLRSFEDQGVRRALTRDPLG